MPRIVIKTLPLDKGLDVPTILKILGNDLAAALDLHPRQMAILWEPILADHFLFDGEVTQVQEKSTHHPIVDITLVQGMPEALEKQMVQTIAQTLSRALAIDYKNICVVINTLAPGKLFVAGEFKKRSVKSG